MKPGIDYIGISTPFYCHDGKGNLLFQKRSKNCRDEIGTWDVGSGQLEFWLTPEQNVLKEIEEEYGCDAIIQTQLPTLSIIRNEKGKKTHWLAIPFVVLVDPKKVINNNPKKIDEIKWFSLNKLPQPLHKGCAFTIKKHWSLLKKYIK